MKLTRADLKESISNSDVVIPEGITELDECLFRDKTTLRKISLPKSLKKIEHRCFQGCENLSEINIHPESELEYIGPYCFHDCPKLHQLDLPDCTQFIGQGTFSRSGIKNFKVPKKYINLESLCFDGCENLSNIEIHSEVVSIMPSTFRNCTSLISIDLKNIIYLSSSIFKGCTSLETIKLHDGIRNLPCNIFQDCQSLKEVNVPMALTSVGFMYLFRSKLSYSTREKFRDLILNSLRKYQQEFSYLSPIDLEYKLKLEIINEMKLEGTLLNTDILDSIFLKVDMDYQYFSSKKKFPFKTVMNLIKTYEFKD